MITKELDNWNRDKILEKAKILKKNGAIHPSPLQNFPICSPPRSKSHPPPIPPPTSTPEVKNSVTYDIEVYTEKQVSSLAWDKWRKRKLSEKGFGTPETNLEHNTSPN